MIVLSDRSSGHQVTGVHNMKTVKFLNWECDLQFQRYCNGRLAIQLTDTEDHSPVATATVNLPDARLGDDEVCIKDYSENEGVLAALVNAKVVSEPVRFESSGWVTIPVCKLLLEVPDAV